METQDRNHQEEASREIAAEQLSFGSLLFERTERKHTRAEELEKLLSNLSDLASLKALPVSELSDDGGLNKDKVASWLSDSNRAASIRSTMVDVIRAALGPRSDSVDELDPALRKVLSDETTPVEARYSALYNANSALVEAHFDLPELELEVCDIKKIQQLADSNKYDDDAINELREKWKTIVLELEERWKELTGEPLGIIYKNVKPIDTLTSKMVGVSSVPGWSDGLSKTEDQYFESGLKSYSSINEEVHQNTRPSESDESYFGDSAVDETDEGDSLTSISSERSSIDGPQTENSDATESGCQAAMGSSLVDVTCNFGDILSEARSNVTKDPANPDAGPNYTFPGTLNTREDIFYDYYIVLPVDDCYLNSQGTEEYLRSLITPKALASQAYSVLNSLTIMGLHLSLGSDTNGAPSLYNKIEEVVSEVLDLPEQQAALSDIGSIRDLRRRLKEFSAALDVIGKLKVNMLQMTNIDPAEKRAELEAALGQLNENHITLKNKHLPWNAAWDSAKEANTLAVRSSGSGGYKEVPDTDGYTYNALNFGAQHQYYWQKGTQRNEVRPYLMQLGDWFYRRLINLISSAEEVNESLREFQQQGGASYPERLRQYERFFSIQLTEIIRNIARLLREIADTIPLPETEPKEGNIRLGVQLVYRQRWFPNGYIRGKIVGHKNLAPNQEEKVTRKTYIKSITDTQTLDEFIASRVRESSQNRKETAELLSENAAKFGFSASAGGKFSYGVGGFNFDAESSTDLEHTSRKAQTSIADMTQKSSSNYNEKREVKVKDYNEIYDETESINTIKNANQEITANYFYYQLLREYVVTVDLADIRPVLLRTREIPTPSTIDADFLSKNIHIFLRRLPDQLSDDLQSTINDIDGLSRKYLHSQNRADRLEAEWEAYVDGPIPRNSDEDPTARDDWDRRLQELRQRMEESKTVAINDKELFLRAQTRIDRVVHHVRENRLHYMQYIWAENPTVDHDALLKNERIHTPSGSFSLPEVTRGLIREGYDGNEEIFAYNGPAIRLAEILADHVVLGSEIASGLTDAELRETSLFRVFEQFYSSGEIEDVIALFKNSAFAVDPAGENTVLSTRKVQVAQDALVVETLPGQVPLLEGFQMAHRMLHIKGTCLENQHLAQRIVDRPWNNDVSRDDYNVRRYEGASPVEREVHD